MRILVFLNVFKKYIGFFQMGKKKCTVLYKKKVVIMRVI